MLGAVFLFAQFSEIEILVFNKNVYALLNISTP